MRRLTCHRPSPAMVVACLALLVALGGTSIAAVSQLVPRNSVGTAQLKNNAVTSLKVKNRSLQAADFAQGQIPAGPPGSKGDTGLKGDKGEKGDRGNVGPSDAYSVARLGVAVPGLTATTVASLSIPQAGKYVIWGKVYFEAALLGSAVVGCDLRAEADVDVSYVTPFFDGRNSLPATLTTIVVHEFSGPGTADLVCTPTRDVGAGRARVTAIRVANLTSTG
jgi:hypothetical protein